MLNADVGLRFRSLGDQFTRPPAVLEGAVGRARKAGVVRAAGRSAVDWGRGVWATPRVVGQRLGSQLSIPVHTFRAWRDGGQTAARRSLASELESQAATTGASIVAAGGLAERLMRFTTIGPALLVGDVREDGLQATLEQHTYDAVQLAPDVLLGGIGVIGRARHLERLADASWVASAPNAAQGARLAETYAALEAWDGTHRLIAGPGGTPFRKAPQLAEAFGDSPDDYLKLATPKYTTKDGRIMETHWVQDVRTGSIVEWKHQVQGWVKHAPRQ